MLLHFPNKAIGAISQPLLQGLQQIKHLDWVEGAQHIGLSNDALQAVCFINHHEPPHVPLFELLMNIPQRISSMGEEERGAHGVARWLMLEVQI